MTNKNLNIKLNLNELGINKIFDDLLPINFAQIKHELNQLEDKSYKVKEYIDEHNAKDWSQDDIDPWGWQRGTNKMKDILCVIETYRMEIEEAEKNQNLNISNEVFESNAQRDSYGLPISLDFTNKALEKLKGSIGDKEIAYLHKCLTENEWFMNKIKDMDYSEQLRQINGGIKTLIEMIPHIVEGIAKEFGNTYQKHITQIQKLFKEARVPTSKKVGKLYRTGKHQAIIRELMPYWDCKINDVDLPDSHNRDSFFMSLSKLYDISFSRVEQLEREYRPIYQPRLARNLTDPKVLPTYKKPKKQFLDGKWSDTE